MTELLPSDTAFSLWLATLQPADLSAWEWRLFRRMKLERGRL